MASQTPGEAVDRRIQIRGRVEGSLLRKNRLFPPGIHDLRGQPIFGARSRNPPGQQRAKVFPLADFASEAGIQRDCSRTAQPLLRFSKLRTWYQMHVPRLLE